MNKSLKTGDFKQMLTVEETHAQISRTNENKFNQNLRMGVNDDLLATGQSLLHDGAVGSQEHLQ